MRKSPRAHLDVGGNFYPYIADDKHTKEVEEMLNNHYEAKSDAQMEAGNKFVAMAKRALKVRSQANKQSLNTIDS